MEHTFRKLKYLPNYPYDRGEKMEQKGVSPVVGTILLIAITVALAAVVATLVSGLGGRGTPPSAMLTVVADENENANTVQ